MPGLLRERDFRLLWAGQGISAVGTAVTGVALPLIALTDLDASPFEIGLVTAASMAAWLVVGLPLGVWVDRRYRRPLLIVADVGRAVLLATVPAAAFAGVLTIAQLVVVALLAGALTVLFDVAYPAYLPAVITRDRLVEGNGVLGATDAAAQIGGPGLGGVLIQVVGAPVTMVIDVVSFLVSAATVRAVRAVEPPPPPPPADRRGRLRAELAEGLRYVFGSVFTRTLVVCGSIANFVLGGYSAVAVVFLYRSVGAGPAVIGVLLAVSGAGAVVGSLLADRLVRRFGDARVVWGAPVVTGGAGLLLPFAFPGPGVLIFAAGAFAFGGGIALFNVCVRAALQGLAPARLLGRISASIRLFSRGAWPLGALTGGALAGAAGPRTALAAMMAGFVLCPLVLRLSPIGRVRTLAELARSTG